MSQTLVPDNNPVAKAAIDVSSHDVGSEKASSGTDTTNSSTATPLNILQKVYQALGFKRAYTFILWFIFGGALFGFILARLQFLSIYGKFCPSTPEMNSQTGLPGLCYSVVTFYRYKVAILLHLIGTLPAGLLAVLQFIPAIRYRFMLYHRIAGYVTLLFMTSGLVGACMLADSPSEGSIATQSSTGLISVVILVCFIMAIYNIKRLQIEQHRAWMLRAWVYSGFVITQRILQIIMPIILTRWDNHDTGRFTALSCDEIAYVYKPTPDLFLKNYPACSPENRATFAPDGMVAVKALLHPDADRAQATAIFNITFIAAGTFAFVLHAVAVETYIGLTKREGERLRNVSYNLQLKKNFKHPGSAGLVPERIGDAEPWVYKEVS